MKNRIITLFTFFILSATTLLAQAPPNPGDGNDPGPGNNPVGVPIDGGASLLLAAGGAIAAFKYIRSKRKGEG